MGLPNKSTETWEIPDPGPVVPIVIPEPVPEKVPVSVPEEAPELVPA